MTLYNMWIQIFLELHIVLLISESILVFCWDPYKAYKELATLFEHIQGLVNLFLFLDEVLIN